MTTHMSTIELPPGSVILARYLGQGELREWVLTYPTGSPVWISGSTRCAWASLTDQQNLSRMSAFVVPSGSVVTGSGIPYPLREGGPCPNGCAASERWEKFSPELLRSNAEGELSCPQCWEAFESDRTAGRQAR